MFSFTVSSHEQQLVDGVGRRRLVQCVDLACEPLPLRQIGRVAAAGVCWVGAVDEAEVGRRVVKAGGIG